MPPLPLKNQATFIFPLSFQLPILHGGMSLRAAALGLWRRGNPQLDQEIATSG
jgi:hypothetical protein